MVLKRKDVRAEGFALQICKEHFLKSLETTCLKRKEILRFAQNDTAGGFLRLAGEGVTPHPSASQTRQIVKQVQQEKLQRASAS